MADLGAKEVCQVWALSATCRRGRIEWDSERANGNSVALSPKSLSSLEMELSPDTVLQLAPAIRTRCARTGHVMVDSPVGTIIDIGPRGFAILAMFSQPIRLGDASTGWSASAAIPLILRRR